MAAALLAVDPAGLGGVVLRCGPGAVRDAWLGHFQHLNGGEAPRRVPAHVSDGRLLGGLDLAATLRTGRPVTEHGILAAADGGMLMLCMAERLTAAAAARITSVLDTGEVVLERDGLAERRPTRFGVIALDEGADADEHPPPALGERLALHLDLSGLGGRVLEARCGVSRADIPSARQRLGTVRAPQATVDALCETAAALGIGSARAASMALRAARAAAALGGRAEVADEDVILAARLVLAPRATRVPAPPQPEPERAEDAAPAEEDPRPSAAEGRDAESLDRQPPETPPQALPERTVAATLAVLPPGLLAQLQGQLAGATRARTSGGRGGAPQRGQLRGRPIGVLAREPTRGARLHVIETLRAAAPWQRLRRAQSGARATRVLVRKQDFRVTRFKQRTQTTAVFVVDASGSAALHRLGEAKGAVELILAECYVRRDRVALIGFSGRGAQILLPPTRSLLRAKRSLAGLPGGGGTPLASGLDAARGLADAVRRRGETPLVILLTDGQANVGRNGKGGRPAAEADALQAARLLRADRTAAVLVDTARQPRPLTAQLAREMGARYLPLPRADAGALAATVRSFAQAQAHTSRVVP
ncbi:MAG: magnesium chelatase subunit D [Proteobacteria bacterium]|nr:magnesium chelatase subunit D [Pseudomonadota bacterium]